MIDTVAKKILSIIPLKLSSKKSSIFKWLLLAIAVRFLLMPIFAHSDFMTTLWISLTYATKGQLIYSVDPPAVYLVLGTIYNMMTPLFPSAFLNFVGSNVAFTPPALFQIISLLQPGIHSVLLLGKIPYMILDVASAFVILHLFDDENKSFFAFKLWLFNPVTIFVSYVFGQTDIFAVFFIILGLYFLKQKRFAYSVLSLSIAGAFKMIGLALIPLVALYFWKTKKESTSAAKTLRIGWLSLISLLPLLVFPLAFSLISQYYESVNVVLPADSMFNGFYGNTFYSMGQAAQPFVSGLIKFLLEFSVSVQTQFSMHDFIYFVPFIYTLVFLGAAIKENLSFERVTGFFTVFLLAYYSFSLFLPQWFFWIQPFLLLLVVNHRKTFQNLYLLTIPLFFIYICKWNAGLTTYLIAPIVPSAVLWDGPVTLTINANLPVYELLSISRTIFSAICIFAAVLLTKRLLFSRNNSGVKESIENDGA